MLDLFYVCVCFGNLGIVDQVETVNFAEKVGVLIHVGGEGLAEQQEGVNHVEHEAVRSQRSERVEFLLVKVQTHRLSQPLQQSFLAFRDLHQLLNQICHAAVKPEKFVRDGVNALLLSFRPHPVELAVHVLVFPAEGLRCQAGETKVLA